jgi:flavin-dependent dehydrogenase
MLALPLSPGMATFMTRTETLDPCAATLTLDGACRRAWSVIIIGAGPAGALAAHELARRGSGVLLVDKAPFPRDKVCGCCLNGAALSQLSACGLGDLVEVERAVRLKDMLLSDGHVSTTLGFPNSVALSRATLDAALVQRAIVAGAQFLSETAAEIGPVENGLRRVALQSEMKSGLAYASVVIAADGLAGSALKSVGGFECRLNAHSHFGVGAILDEAPAFYAPGRLYMALGPGGYVGLVRLEDGRLDLAAAFAPAFTKSAGGIPSAIERTLQDAHFEAIANLRAQHWRGTPLLTRSLTRVAGERIFVVGDAAGYVEPITGEGIAWALRSGARVAALAVAGDKWTPALSIEWTRVYAQLRTKQRTCAVLAQLLRRRGCVRVALSVLNHFPLFARLVLRSLNAPVAV